MARVATMALVGLGGCAFHTNAAVDSPPVEIDAAIVDGPSVEQPMLVQQAKAGAPNSNNPLVATLPAPPIAGHLLVAIGADEAGRLDSVTGGGVASWSLAAQSLANTNIEVWYGVTDGSSATVTVTADQDSLPMWIVVGEWSGASVFDGAKSANGTTSPASAGAQSVHADDLVIFGVADQAPTTFGMPEGGWMPLMPVSSNHTEQRVWFTVAAATGTLAPMVTETALSWDAAVAAFRH